MNRKRWTPKLDVDDAHLIFREKKKWQIALRRYLIEKQPSPFYAPYFKLDIKTFRSWIEVQFPQECSWENFSVNWQLDHVIPLSYFDFSSDLELRLAWNFTNIRIQIIKSGQQTGNQPDLLCAKAYFQRLFDNTQYPICGQMIEKINNLERDQSAGQVRLIQFITDRITAINTISGLSADDLRSLNTGAELKEILAEAEARKKLGLE